MTEDIDKLQPDTVVARSPNTNTVKVDTGGGPAAHASATISSERALTWAFVLIVGLIGLDGYLSLMAIMLLNNFKANQFPQEQVARAALEARVSALERKDEVNQIVKQLQQQLPEKGR